jgi:hypothetical protein
MNLNSHFYSVKILVKCGLNIETIILSNEYQKKNIFLVLTTIHLNCNFYDGILLFLHPANSKTKYL